MKIYSLVFATLFSLALIAADLHAADYRSRMESRKQMRLEASLHNSRYKALADEKRALEEEVEAKRKKNIEEAMAFALTAQKEDAASEEDLAPKESANVEIANLDLFKKIEAGPDRLTLKQQVSDNVYYSLSITKQEALEHLKKYGKLDLKHPDFKGKVVVDQAAGPLQ